MKMRTIFLSLLISVLLFSTTVFAQVTTDTLQPINQNNASGYVGSDNLNHSGDMLVIEKGKNRGYVTFDLNNLPNGAVIVSATLSINAGVVINVTVSNSSEGPVTRIAKNSVFTPITYNDIASGELIGSLNFDGTPGPKAISINAQGIAALNQSAGGTFCFGIKEAESGNYQKIGGYNSTDAVAQPPSLTIGYTMQAPQKPYPSFYAEKTSVRIDSAVKFFDNSGNAPTAWLWNFGDGATSTLQNPTHIYADTLEYTVSLKATNSVGDSTLVKNNYIKIRPIPPAPISGFTVDNNRPYRDSTIMFIDTSKNNPVSWKWSFGDDSISTVQNPSHKYLTAGKYTVTLITTIADGRKDTLAITDYIEVLPDPAIPNPDFTYFVNGLTVNFIDNSDNYPSVWSWDYGDASTLDSIPNPIHTYSTAGTYNVTLTVSNIKGDTSVTKQLIVVPNSEPIANDDDTIAVKNVAVDINILSNDFDLDGSIDTSSISIQKMPLHGIVVINYINGTINYNPSSDYLGTDTFSYFFSDNDGAESNEAMVYIEVVDVENLAPIAINDDKSLDKNTETSIFILANDTDIDGTIDTTSIFIVSAPKYGSAIINSINGSITYMPVTDYVGFDTLKYTIQDNRSDVSNTASVYITVNNTNGIANGYLNQLNVYPNPSSGIITINLAGINALKHLEVYNSIGMLVISEELNSKVDAHQLNVGHLPEGLYSVLIKTEQSNYLARILVKR